MSRRRALTNLTVAPPEHAEEVGTLKELGAHQPAGTWDACLSNKFSSKLLWQNMLNFTCLRNSVVFWQLCGIAKMAMIHKKKI
jgi:hypothetical protein